MLKPIGFCYVCGCIINENITLCSENCIKEYEQQSDNTYITEEEIDQFCRQQEQDWFFILIHKSIK